MLCPRFLSKASALSSSTRIAASLHSSAEGYSDDVRFAGLDGSFECPRVTTTAVPGPRTQELMKTLNEFQLSSSVQIVTDYQRSSGNYMVDADGNILMDLYQQIGSLALGYNNPTILASIEDPLNKSLIASRPALGLAPPIQLIGQLQSTLLSVTPKGMGNILPMMCGACSNENALKVAFMWYMGQQRDGRDIGQQEINSAALNTGPGSPKISVMSFAGAFHGRTTCMMSLTHSNPFYKVDLPAFDWPVAPFPILKYPLEDHTRENSTEERRCLEVAEDLFHQYSSHCPVAAVIIEPIQSEGGDRHASPEFFRGLQEICKKNNAAFIVDEIQTGGGGTGRMWAHESWDLPQSPHLVTFAKKFQMAGMFASDGVFPKQPLRIFNTWMGDHSKYFVLKAILQEIKRLELFELVKSSGAMLLEGLKEIQDKHPSVIHSARGVGTYCAFSTVDSDSCAKLVQQLRNRGVIVGMSGVNSIRFRPALIFQPRHANMFLEILNDTIKEMHN